MKRMLSPAVFAFVLVGSADTVAQLLSYKEAPVRISHYHLNVTSIEAQKKFVTVQGVCTFYTCTFYTDFVRSG
jgi:hypothetical protein